MGSHHHKPVCQTDVGPASTDFVFILQPISSAPGKRKKGRRKGSNP